MNMYRLAALGLVVTAAIAGCDTPEYESGVDRQDASMSQSVDEAANQERAAESEFSTVEHSTDAAYLDAREEAPDVMQGAEYGLAREKCDELSGDARDACIEQAQADFARD